MKTTYTNYEIQQYYDVYCAKCTITSRGDMRFLSRWEFTQCISQEELKSALLSREYFISDNYFLCETEGTVHISQDRRTISFYAFLLAPIRTKQWVNLTSLKNPIKSHQYYHHCYKRRRKKIFRHPQHHNSQRHNMSKNDLNSLRNEYPQARVACHDNKIRYLPTTWDEYTREYQKSWKWCTKKRKQYKEGGYE